jgi:hypothetical protein
MLVMLYVYYFIGEMQVNRLCNIAFGYNTKRSAKEALRLILADKLREEERKAKAIAEETPEARAIKEAKKKKTQERAKATRARNKQAKQNELAAIEEANLDIPAPAFTALITSDLETANVSPLSAIGLLAVDPPATCPPASQSNSATPLNSTNVSGLSNMETNLIPGAVSSNISALSTASFATSSIPATATATATATVITNHKCKL